MRIIPGKYEGILMFLLKYKHIIFPNAINKMLKNPIDNILSRIRYLPNDMAIPTPNESIERAIPKKTASFISRVPDVSMSASSGFMTISSITL